MRKILKLTVSLGVILLFVSCSTSMSPIEVSNTLPTMTKSKYLTQSQADESTKTNNCKYLTKGRNYVAAIGMSAKDDLQDGARGIDEWVKLDGGNSYVLKNFRWITVDQNGSTQLHIDFDTLLCE